MTHPIEGLNYITFALCVNSPKRRFKHDYAIFEKAQNLRSTFGKTYGFRRYFMSKVASQPFTVNLKEVMSKICFIPPVLLRKY